MLDWGRFACPPDTTNATQQGRHAAAMPPIATIYVTACYHYDCLIGRRRSVTIVGCGGTGDGSSRRSVTVTYVVRHGATSRNNRQRRSLRQQQQQQPHQSSAAPHRDEPAQCRQLHAPAGSTSRRHGGYQRITSARQTPASSRQAAGVHEPADVTSVSD